MKRLLTQLSVSLVLLLVLITPASALEIPSAPTSRIADQADILTAEEESQIAAQIQALDLATEAEIGVLTLMSLEGEVLEEFANETFRAWGIGKADQNNGILLLISMEERAMRIEVGYGLEGVVTDLRASQIIDIYIAPQFQAGQFATGVEQGISAIEQLIAGDLAYELDTAAAASAADDISPFAQDMGILTTVIFTMFILTAIIFSAIFGSGVKKTTWIPPVIIVTVILLFILRPELLAIIISLILAIISEVLIRWLLSKEATPGRHFGEGPHDRDIPPSDFGSSSGGDSFGGGSSGGGGASGGW